MKLKQIDLAMIDVCIERPMDCVHLSVILGESGESRNISSNKKAHPVL